MEPIAELRKRKKTYAAVKIAAAFVVLAVMGVTGVSTYVGWALTHPSHKPLNATPSDMGMNYESIAFRNNDGLTLRGWSIAAAHNGYSPNGKTVVYVHSYQSNRLEEGVGILSLVSELLPKGYNAILFDMRANGESEGKLSSIGYLEKDDVLAAVDKARQLFPKDKLIVHGFSMGASTAILAAGENEEIAAVIADSPFDNLKPFLQDNLSHWSGLPNFPFTPMILGVMPLLTGIEVEKVNPKEAAERLTDRQSLFLIHGLADSAIPYASSEALDQASGSPSTTIWLVPGADHVNSRKVDPETYDRKTMEFLDGL